MNRFIDSEAAVSRDDTDDSEEDLETIERDQRGMATFYGCTLI